MYYSIVLFLAIIAYLLATTLIARQISVKGKQISQDQSPQFRLAFSLASLAALAHGVYAYNVGQLDGAINLSLSAMSAVVSAMLVLVFLLGCLNMPIRRLGILVFPLASAGLLFSFFWQSEAFYLSDHSGAFGAHVLISILAYSLLAIAAVQALLYVYHERQLKNHTAPTMLLALPPLQTMEQLLFRLLGVGFLLLSLTLLSGALFSQQIFGQPFEFKHHTILALLGWLVFAVLLHKRYRHGLRGSQAVIWTISGFILIQLGYFGTKIVTESLNIH